MSAHKLLPTFLFLLFLLPSISFGQVLFKLELMPDSTKWGIFATPTNDINPSSNTITGTGQITLVVPTGYEFGDLENIHGNWGFSGGQRVVSPVENPSKDYLSFGLNQDVPKIILIKDEETLLFTIGRIGACPEELNLIENDTDPFARLPNSVGINPGNDLSTFDINTNQTYFWIGNYDMCAWSCLPCTEDVSSSDEINLTGLEIFPNPSNGSFKIDLGLHAQSVDNIKIFNTIGKQVYQNNKIGTSMNLDLDLSKGLYFVSFENENRTLQTQRIIISK